MSHFKLNQITLAIFCLGVASISIAEEQKLSQEYTAARTEVMKELRAVYNSCTREIGSKYYSKFYKNCLEDPQNKIRKERCGHEAQLATEKYMHVENAAAPCKHLEPQKEDYRKRLKQIVLERNIKKYE